MNNTESIAKKSMVQIFKETLTKNFINAKGRVSRREFWLFQLAYGLIISLFMLFAGILVSFISNSPNSPYYVIIPVCLFALITFIPLACISIRRVHDVGYSGWFFLLVFFPILCILVFIFYVTPSQKGSNKYGPNPYEVDDKSK